jgi:hypothetical protein
VVSDVAEFPWVLSRPPSCPKRRTHKRQSWNRSKFRQSDHRAFACARSRPAHGFEGNESLRVGRGRKHELGRLPAESRSRHDSPSLTPDARRDQDLGSSMIFRSRRSARMFLPRTLCRSSTRSSCVSVCSQVSRYVPRTPCAQQSSSAVAVAGHSLTIHSPPRYRQAQSVAHLRLRPGRHRMVRKRRP